MYLHKLHTHSIVYLDTVYALLFFVSVNYLNESSTSWLDQKRPPIPNYITVQDKLHLKINLPKRIKKKINCAVKLCNHTPLNYNIGPLCKILLIFLSRLILMSTDHWNAATFHQTDMQLLNDVCTVIPDTLVEAQFGWYNAGICSLYLNSVGTSCVIVSKDAISVSILLLSPMSQ